MSYSTNRFHWRSYVLVHSVLSAFAPATLTATAMTSALAPTQIASVYSLTYSTTLPMPTTSLDSQSTFDFLNSSSGWEVSKNGRVTLHDDISFVTNPIDKSTSAPVFDVYYPQGSYSNSKGGTSFSTYFNDSSSTDQFQTMMISYEIAFPSGFQFAKGGQLPGLRGGALDNCDGVRNSGLCFTMRLMWGSGGTAEVYAYIQDTAICTDPNVTCNQYGYGTSIGRGKFYWNSGAWNRIDLIVGLNNPPDKSNGFVNVYHDGVLAISQTGIQIRSNSSVENIQGMFFSTFFGGSDSSWATPIDQNTYFRNIQLFASDDLASSPPSPSSSALILQAASLNLLLGLLISLLLFV